MWAYAMLASLPVRTLPACWLSKVGPLEVVRTVLAKVAELADAPDLGSGTERCGVRVPLSHQRMKSEDQRSEVRPGDAEIRSLTSDL